MNNQQKQFNQLAKQMISDIAECNEILTRYHEAIEAETFALVAKETKVANEGLGLELI